MKGTKGTEIVLSLENKVGALGQVASILKEAGLNIRAVSGWVEQDKAVVRLVASDNQRAKEILSAQFDAVEKEVVVVEMANEIGKLDDLASQLKAAGVDMLHIYGTTPGQGQMATLVFASDDNQKALEAISL